MIGRNREVTNYDYEISRQRHYIGRRVAAWAGASALGGAVAAASEVFIAGEVTNTTAAAGLIGATAVAYVGGLAEFAFGEIEGSLRMISDQKYLRSVAKNPVPSEVN